jgi:hypothetical protein
MLKNTTANIVALLTAGVLVITTDIGAGPALIGGGVVATLLLVGEILWVHHGQIRDLVSDDGDDADDGDRVDPGGLSEPGQSPILEYGAEDEPAESDSSPERDEDGAHTPVFGGDNDRGR